jgi:hypothetical protein
VRGILGKSLILLAQWLVVLKSLNAFFLLLLLDLDNKDLNSIQYF